MNPRKVRLNLIRASIVIILHQIWQVWSPSLLVLSNYYRQTISSSHLSAILRAFIKCHTRVPPRLTTLPRTASKYFQPTKAVTQETRLLKKTLSMTLTSVIQAVALACIGHRLFHQTSNNSTWKNKIINRSNWTCRISTSSITAQSTTILITLQLVGVCTPRVISSRHSRRHQPSCAKLQQSRLFPPHRRQEAT